MGREVNFRAWDNVANEMLYCGENIDVLFMLGSAGIECTDIRNVSPDGHDVYKEHLKYMQYTGLKDKNGKKIYEGDILGLKGCQDLFVEFYDGCFVAKSTNKIQRVNWTPSSLRNLLNHKYTIIGNIYENVELLDA